MSTNGVEKVQADLFTFSVTVKRRYCVACVSLTYSLSIFHKVSAPSCLFFCEFKLFVCLFLSQSVAM